MRFRVELLCSDLDIIRIKTAGFAIIGRSGAEGATYAELSTNSLETATGWRQSLDTARRQYKYITDFGSDYGNDPTW